MRQKNIHGGGAKTNKNGLAFERQTDLLTALKEIDYLEVSDLDVFFDGKKVAFVTEQHKFYKLFLNTLGVDWKQRVSKKLLPDAFLLNYVTSEVFIIEKKFQERTGSVDEKLQTCDFKLKQYGKLLEGTEYKPYFIFLLNDWYKRPEYADVKTYIRSVGCDYYFNELPLAAIKMDIQSLSLS